jgi:uncharacterized protein YcfJ
MGSHEGAVIDALMGGLVGAVTLTAIHATARTRVLTVAWYLAGGLAAAATFRRLQAARQV